MSPTIRVHLTITAAAAILGAAGCAGAGQSSPGGVVAGSALPAAVQHAAAGTRGLYARSIFTNGRFDPRHASDRSWMSPDAVKGGRVYVNELTCGCAYIYPLGKRNPKPVGQLTNLNGPDQLTAAADGSVWVAEQGAHAVVRFARGKTTPSTVLDDTGYVPVDIQFDGKGNAFVSNAGSTSGGPGNVLIYPKGQTTPSQTLYDPSFQTVLGIAVDKAGDVFAVLVDNTGARFLGEFVAGPSGSYTYTTLVPQGQLINNYILRPALDANGSLVVASQGASSIYVFSPPNWGQTATFGGSAGTSSVAFNRTRSNIYAAYINDHAVVEYAYPSTKQLNEIIDGLFYPLAVTVAPAPSL